MGFSVPRAEVGVSVPSHTPVTSTVISVRSIQSVCAQPLEKTRATPMTTQAGLIRLARYPARTVTHQAGLRHRASHPGASYLWVASRRKGWTGLSSPEEVLRRDRVPAVLAIGEGRSTHGFSRPLARATLTKTLSCSFWGTSLEKSLGRPRVTYCQNRRNVGSGRVGREGAR